MRALWLASRQADGILAACHDGILTACHDPYAASYLLHRSYLPHRSRLIHPCCMRECCTLGAGAGAADGRDSRAGTAVLPCWQGHIHGPILAPRVHTLLHRTRRGIPSRCVCLGCWVVLVLRLSCACVAHVLYVRVLCVYGACVGKFSVRVCLPLDLCAFASLLNPASLLSLVSACVCVCARWPAAGMWTLCERSRVWACSRACIRALRAWA